MRISVIAVQVAACVLLISFLLLFAGYQIHSRQGLFIALILAIAWMTLLWYSDDSRWLSELKARPLKGQDPDGLQTQVSRLATQLHMRPPELHLTEHRSAFALSLSLGSQSEHLILSQSLLKHLSKEEIESVLASELVSLWLRRKFRFRWVHLMARAWLKIFEVIESSVPFLGRRRWLSTLAEPVGRLILRVGQWRAFVTERDRIALAMAPSRQALASALWKLSHLGQAYPFSPPLGSKHLFLVNPGRSDFNAHVLSLHLPLNLRLRRIIGAELI